MQIAAVLFAVVTATAAAAVADPMAVNAPSGVALSGYDTVAYFTDRAARQGLPEHRLKWRGAMWFFVSDANLERFEMDPMAYVPQYGGFCAFSAAQGEVQPGDPTAFAVHDGKLYLIHSRAELDTWAADIPGNVTRANALWPQIAPH
jgi:hypothetical protein